MLKYAARNKKFARELRRNMTDAERLLWSKIRLKQFDGHQWYRQKPIGPYIVDFYCPKLSASIEVDGGQHYENQGMRYDADRDEYLLKIGLRTIRFTNVEVLQNIEGVLLQILESLVPHKSPSSPFIKGGDSSLS